MAAYLKKFKNTTLADRWEVGDKNASLGEIFSRLPIGKTILPDGFAVTVPAFWKFIQDNQLREPLGQLMDTLDRENFSNLKDISRSARQLILQAQMPQEIIENVIHAYREMEGAKNKAVAVRSSAVADGNHLSRFTGQFDSFLNVHNEEALMTAIQKCFASLYSDRAIKYREDNGITHDKIAMAVGVQAMVRSDKACSGLAFSQEPESGFNHIIHISGIWGLGENMEQGLVSPDEFLVFKPTLLKGKNAIIQKLLGSKAKTLVYSGSNIHTPVINIETPDELQGQYVLADPEIMQLAHWVFLIERHFNQPLEIEWAKDGLTNRIYIIQATVRTAPFTEQPSTLQEYQLQEKGTLLTSGRAIGHKIVTGKAKVLRSPDEAGQLKGGEIVVTNIASPAWLPVLKKAAAFISNKGGLTSQAALVARELHVPAIVGCGNATEVINDGDVVTVSCSEGSVGHIYKGSIPFQVVETDFSAISKPENTKVMLIVDNPDEAFKYAAYPNDGVALVRVEYIIRHFIRIHPLALVKFFSLQDYEVKRQIEKVTHHCPDKKRYFIEMLARGMATIAAAFYPKDVNVLLSNTESGEYAELVGSTAMQGEEEKTVAGFQGASPYYKPRYSDVFALECYAVKMVREDMGLENLKVILPSCRTVEEAKKSISLMEQCGLERNRYSTLQLYMMIDVANHVSKALEFASLFDGFYIGSHTPAYLSEVRERDTARVQQSLAGQNEAVKMIIEKVLKAGKKIGLCWQASGDEQAFAPLFTHQGVGRVSFRPDALVKGIEDLKMSEETMKQTKAGV